jgi:adenylosuccinate lyase
VLKLIERYSLPEISGLWSLENKYSTWLKVELAVCSAYNKIGIIPDSSLKTILKNARFNLLEVEEIEKTTRHDVIAFLTNVAKYVGEDSRFIHLGLTSSDIGDTSFSLILKESLLLVLLKVEALSASIKRKALKYKYTQVMGRTHGIHAEPVTYGFKLLIFYEDIKRMELRIKTVIETLSCGKLSGAVGTYANIPPEVELDALKSLGLRPILSNQVISRDIYADVFYALAVLGASCEKIALEIRHLMRTEVSEVEEPFSSGQKGSSAMPHKKNPIVSENICGLSRILRSNLIAALENIALWHERDISHSSVERIIGPDSTILSYYILSQLIDVIDNMIINEDKMLKNMELTRGVIFSQKVLLSLVNKGISREDAYKIVQSLAHKAIKSETDFKIILKNDPLVLKYLTADEIDSLFDVNYYFRYIDYIFDRSLGVGDS